ncbi:MAG: tandem-95 repeat protein [Candidatus Magnetomorum sp.]|nr:tandem-95 repeat protein [Candidatus Magnetomorum sp.]
MNRHVLFFLFILIFFCHTSAFSQCDECEHFTDVVPNNQTMFISGYIEDDFFQIGDEIGFFTPDGFCCGSAMINNDNNIKYYSTEVYGDDPNTPKIEGIKTNELLIIIIWDTSESKEIILKDHQLYPHTWNNIDPYVLATLPLKYYSDNVYYAVNIVNNMAISPEYSQSVISNGTTFTWNVENSDPENRLSYQFCLDSNCYPTTEKTFTPTIVEDGNTHTWQVVTHDYTQTAGPIWSFTSYFNRPPEAKAKTSVINEDITFTGDLEGQVTKGPYCSFIDGVYICLETNEPISYYTATAPSHGKLILNQNTGKFTYTPDTNYCATTCPFDGNVYGEDFFSYYAKDFYNQSNIAQYTIKLTCACDPIKNISNPYISGAWIVGEPLTANRGEWLNPEGCTIDFTFYWQQVNPDNGLTIATPGNETTFTPSSQYAHQYFRLRLVAKGSCNETKTIYSHTSEPYSQLYNSIPVISNENIYLTRLEDSSEISFSLNASDKDDDRITWRTTPVSKALVTLTQNNTSATLKFQPKMNECGLITFDIFAEDNYGGSARIFASIDVENINDPPLFKIAHSTSTYYQLAIDEDVNGSIQITDIHPGGKTDCENDSLHFTVSSNSEHLTPTISYQADQTTATINYELAPDVYGSAAATITITLSDGEYLLTKYIEVSINPQNDPPQNEILPAFTGNMLVGNVLTVSNNGTWNDNKDNQVFSGSFSYQWQRSAIPDINFINIDQAQDKHYTLTSEDAHHYICLKVIAIDNGVGEPEHMTSAVQSNCFLVENTPPVLSETTTVSMDEDSNPQSWQMPSFVCDDVDNDSLTFTSTPPEHGVVTIDGEGCPPTIMYTPDENIFGADGFILTANDHYGGTDEMYVIILINARNDAPEQINPPEIQGTPHTGHLLTSSNARWRDTIDNPAIEFTCETMHCDYQWQWSENKTQIENISNAYSDTYRVKEADDKQYLRVMVTLIDDMLPDSLQISAISDWLLITNTAPVITVTDPVMITATEDMLFSSIIENVSAVDNENDIFTWEIVDPPQHDESISFVETGSLNPFISYAPENDFCGMDTVSIRVRDTLGLISNTVVITIHVLPVNDLPQHTELPSLNLIDPNKTVHVGETIMANTGNWNDLKDCQYLQYSQDQCTETNDFSFAYKYFLADDDIGTNATEIAGEISNQYTLRAEDHQKQCIYVVVSATDDDISPKSWTEAKSACVPIANREPEIASHSLSFSMSEDQVPVAWTLRNLEATDPDGDTLYWSIESNPYSGNVSIVASNPTVISYTPNANVNGTDIFMLTVSDTLGGTDTSIITVTILPIDDPPYIFTPISDIRVNEGYKRSDIDLSNIFSDIDNDDASIIKTLKSIQTSNGKHLVSASISVDTLTIDYDANDFLAEGEIATATLTVMATSNTLTTTASFFISITGVDDPPYVKNTIGDRSVYEDVRPVIDLSTTFDDPDNDNTNIQKRVVSFYAGLIAQATIKDNRLQLDLVNNAKGVLVIIIEAESNGYTVQTQFMLIVIAVCDSPHVAHPIIDISVDEDAQYTRIDLSDVFYDVDFNQFQNGKDNITKIIQSNTNANNSILSASILDNNTLEILFNTSENK